MKKTCIVTISIGDVYSDIASLTHPSIKEYAEKIGADFYAIDEKAISQTTPHWEKFQIYHLLGIYDRIIYVDSDVIIRDDCPNLFDIVPETHLGMFNEAPFTDRSKELMIDICRSYNTTLDSWNGKYYNTGVMVVSKYHQQLFKKPEQEISNFYEQSYLNMIIAKREIQIYELTHLYNRMSCVDGAIGIDRHDSYIIHYAGFPNLKDVLLLIANDIEQWKVDAPDYIYRHHIYISVNGGMGDQLCAEPVIRYMKTNLYINDKIVVATHNPEFFEHLDVEVVLHGEANLDMKHSWKIMTSLPDPDSLQWGVVSHMMSHTVDYISMALLRRTLPNHDKTIMGFEDYRNKTKLDNTVLVHPGRHWESKTLPAWWWNQVMELLDKEGFEIILIGQDQRGDPPFYKSGARGTVDVEVKEEYLDMRNKLNVDRLSELISQAPVLLSNDSFPVHLAGAFDNWIVLIPSCKHPDHVLPYRNGTTQHKTKALYKRLILDDIETRPTQMYQTSADVNDIDWDEYLPEPEDVAQYIRMICRGEKDKHG
jgi:hypothetical protein